MILLTNLCWYIIYSEYLGEIYYKKCLLATFSVQDITFLLGPEGHPLLTYSVNYIITYWFL